MSRSLTRWFIALAIVTLSIPGALASLRAENNGAYSD